MAPKKKGKKSAAPLDPALVAEKKRMDLKQAFDIIDKRHLGVISPIEASMLLRSMGHVLTDADLNDLIQEYTVYATGGFTFENCAQILVNLENRASAILRLEEAFKLFDHDGNGFVSISELKERMMNTGQAYTEEEFEEFSADIPTGNDGMVNIKDFVQILIQAVPKAF